MSDETFDFRMERLLRTLPPASADGVTHASDVVAWAIREIDRLREERRWIPVGERLPKVDTTVLAVTRAFPQDIRLAQMASHDGVMWRFCDMDDDDVDSFGITHWMPRPAPPSEGEVEG